MRLLITGGSGLLGSAIALKSTKRGYDTFTGFNQHQATEGTPIFLDITNQQIVEDTFIRVRPDVIVHSAAVTHVDRCEENQSQATFVNVDGTYSITKEAMKHSSFLVYISTDYVFSGDKGNYKETDEPHPINHYGATKLEGERIVANYLNHCIVRPSVIYGSRPAAGKENFALWILKQLKEKKRIQIVNDQWVSPTLNTNLAEMILEVLERRLTGIFHLSGATQINRYDFTVKIAREFDLDDTLIDHVTSKEMKWSAKRPMNSSLNVGKAFKTLRFKPMEIDEALRSLRTDWSI